MGKPATKVGFPHPPRMTVATATPGETHPLGFRRGTWHRISAKHLPAYLDEMTWRFNNRKNPYLFRDTMLKLIHSENLEYKELTNAA
jgi:hypothetical protein